MSKERGRELEFLVTGGILGILVGVGVMGLITLHTNLEEVKLSVVVTAAAMGALGGFAHDIVQNKRVWLPLRPRADTFWVPSPASFWDLSADCWSVAFFPRPHRFPQLHIPACQRE